jgi:hypothetical protein
MFWMESSRERRHYIRSYRVAQRGDDEPPDLLAAPFGPIKPNGPLVGISSENSLTALRPPLVRGDP